MGYTFKVEDVTSAAPPTKPLVRHVPNPPYGGANACFAAVKRHLESRNVGNERSRQLALDETTDETGDDGLKQVAELLSHLQPGEPGVDEPDHKTRLAAYKEEHHAAIFYVLLAPYGTTELCWSNYQCLKFWHALAKGDIEAYSTDLSNSKAYNFDKPSKQKDPFNHQKLSTVTTALALVGASSYGSGHNLQEIDTHHPAQKKFLEQLQNHSKSVGLGALFMQGRRATPKLSALATWNFPERGKEQKKRG